MLSANSAVVRMLASDLTKDESGLHILWVARTKKGVEQSGEAVRAGSVQVVAMGRRGEDITHWRGFSNTAFCGSSHCTRMAWPTPPPQAHPGIRWHSPSTGRVVSVVSFFGPLTLLVDVGAASGAALLHISAFWRSRALCQIFRPKGMCLTSFLRATKGMRTTPVTTRPKVHIFLSRCCTRSSFGFGVCRA
jgi:hypothetical protein